jgi:DNA gyrase/topoisomerase IV subunit B
MKKVLIIQDNEQFENGMKAIQKRPGMFLGGLGNKRVFNLFYHIQQDFDLREDTTVYLSWEHLSFKLKMENIDIQLDVRKYVEPKYVYRLEHDSALSIASIYYPIALSHESKLVFKSLNNEILLEQEFKRGKYVQGSFEEKTYLINKFELDFVLDKRFFYDKELSTNNNYLVYRFQEFAFLNRGTLFELCYPLKGKIQNIQFQYENGLDEKVTLKEIDCYDKTLIPIYLKTELDDFSIEVSMRFLSNDKDQPHLSSYVNSLPTNEHGTHVDAIIEGIQLGIGEYLIKQNLTNEYKLTKEQILQNIILVLNIRLKYPSFDGSTRDKLVSEYIQPFIVDHIKASILFELGRDSSHSIELLKALIFIKNYRRLL